MRIVPLKAFVLLGIFFLCSCGSAYFQAVRTTPSSPVMVGLPELSRRDLWSGIVFNGEKVGFTHIRVIPMHREGLFRIVSEAHLRIRFLGLDRKVAMKGEDVVRADLTLVSFHHEIDLGEKPLVVEGLVEGAVLRTTERVDTEVRKGEEKLAEAIYPAAGINFYPVLHGLATGRSYRFLVYDPQTRSVTEVNQVIAGFEESPKLGVEPSWKIRTTMLGQDVETWINPQGEAVFELGYHGVLITYKETETEARRYLSEAALNKKDVVFDFSVVKTEKALPHPREATFLDCSLRGLGGELPILQGPGQEATQEGEEVRYRIWRDKLTPARVPDGEEGWRNMRWLLPAAQIESDHPEIRAKARELTAGMVNALDKIVAITRWVAATLVKEPVEAFSAVAALRTQKGECQAHTMLYAALARAAGIPTRLVGGLVYMENTGFFYHAWAESYADGWVAVDPTFGQVGVDATHLKLVEGPDWPSLMSIGRVVGRLKITIHAYQAP
ncbi:MAG: transglutaminase-like domain-containing protein [Syntrophales bacterium]|nr:transglutaminase-like domain-containing protein [Syntrophales bacterium]